jgi:hypothetical protein
MLRGVFVYGYNLGMTTNETPRATAITDLAADLDVDPIAACMDVIDGMDTTSTRLHVLIAASFTSDDDGDDMVHEIEHALLECDGTGDDCPWTA